VTDPDYLQSAAEVFSIEAQAIKNMARRIGPSFEQACRLILDCQGRVIVIGMGKSGHVGGKLASTLASTGTPAFFVHPGEASHGDLGMITPIDLVLAISNSGETPEVLTILPIIKRLGIKLIALVGNTDSTLSIQADVALDVAVDNEACPMNLAPTASTTATIAMGDALSIAVLKAREFTEQDFARAHPGGILGRRLLLFVQDIMRTGDAIPVVNEGESLGNALMEMTSKGLGMTGITNDDQCLVGIYTDGDLRRTLKDNTDIQRALIADVMTTQPYTVQPDMLAAEMITMMRSNSINGVFVVDDQGHIVGALNMHDLLRAGVV
jgi:arabinose-5-phosphate isomerase